VPTTVTFMVTGEFGRGVGKDNGRAGGRGRRHD